jgi:molybdopterin-binding protein
MQLSARNQLKGKVTEITLGTVAAQVVLELGTGELVTSTITRSSVESLKLKVGDEVVAIIKSSEVIIGK